MTRLTRLVAAFAILLACARPAESHSLDEYLQATRIAIARERIVLEIDLTAGVTVATEVFARIDRDGDRQVSALEIEAYGKRVLQDLVLELDARPYPLTLTRADCPSWSEIREGDGTIRLEAVAEVPLGTGRHRLRYTNAHSPAIGVYLVNALVPSTRAITITAQRRDVRQRGIDLDVDVAAPYSALRWTILSGLGFAALLVGRRRRSSIPTSRTSWPSALLSS